MEQNKKRLSKSYTKWLTHVNAAKGAFSVFYNIWCCNFLDYVLICKSLKLKSPVVHQYVYIDKSPIIKQLFLLQHRVTYPGQTLGMKKEVFSACLGGCCRQHFRLLLASLTVLNDGCKYLKWSMTFSFMVLKAVMKAASPSGSDFVT